MRDAVPGEAQARAAAASRSRRGCCSRDCAATCESTVTTSVVEAGARDAIDQRRRCAARRRAGTPGTTRPDSRCATSSRRISDEPLMIIGMFAAAAAARQHEVAAVRRERADAHAARCRTAPRTCGRRASSAASASTTSTSTRGTKPNSSNAARLSSSDQSVFDRAGDVAEHRPRQVPPRRDLEVVERQQAIAMLAQPCIRGQNARVGHRQGRYGLLVQAAGVTSPAWPSDPAPRAGCNPIRGRATHRCARLFRSVSGGT